MEQFNCFSKLIFGLGVFTKEINFVRPSFNCRCNFFFMYLLFFFSQILKWLPDLKFHL